MIHVGQRVMVIARFDFAVYAPPPIGSVGEILVGLDMDGDYEVLIDGWPCIVTPHDPAWFIPAWALIPIDDGLPVEAAEQETVA